MRFSFILCAGLALATAGCYENFSDPAYLGTYKLQMEPVALAAGAGGGGYALYVTEECGGGCSVVRTSHSADGTVWSTGSSLGSPLEFYGGAMIADRSATDTAYGAYAAEYFNGPELMFMRTTSGAFGWSHQNALGSILLDAPYPYLYLAQNPLDLNTLVAVLGNADKIAVTRSSDGGVTWGTPWTVTTAAADYALRPQGLQYLDDDTLVLFYGYDGPSNPNYYVRRSTNDGTSWSSRIKVNSSVSGALNMGGDLLFADNDRLHAAWASELNYKHAFSTDGGLTWSSNEILDWTLPIAPKLAAAPGGSPLLLSVQVYEEALFYNLFYHQYDGTSWSARRRINNVIGSAAANAGLICTTDNIMVATWQDWDDRVGASNLAALVSYSDPARTDDLGVEIDDATIFGDVQRGDAISFSYLVGNYTDSDATIDVWVTYVGLSNFTSGTLKTHANVTLSAGEERVLSFSANVHPAAPFQDYKLTVHTGDAGANDTWDQDSFVATVVP